MNIKGWIDKLRYNEAGLIPVIAQDGRTGEVRMSVGRPRGAAALGAPDGGALLLAQPQPLWKKGESSGDVQKLIGMLPDCDLDSVLYLIEQTGAGACHTGARNCFSAKGEPRARRWSAARCPPPRCARAGGDHRFGAAARREKILHREIIIRRR